MKTMDDITKDERFSHIVRDAKFRKLPKQQVKVKVDKRFESMFHEKKFQVQYQVDKRGRSVKLGGNENLKKYYEISDSDSDTSEDEEEKEKTAVVDTSDATDIPNKNFVKVTDAEKNLLTPDIKKKLKDLTIDYARGEGEIYSDSSSDEETTDEEDQVEFEHAWGELDKDADRTDQATSRLAVCNLDWDRIHATDIMVLCNSFVPSGGLIHSVTIYPSEFGLKRMKEEEEKGPTELREDTNEAEGEEELSKIQMEKLRKYQLNRLKYFYAVVVCNSPETAEAIYNECDGLDYENSSSRLDFRFVPDEMTFDQEPKESCTELPDLSTYKPRYFITSALTKAKVDLTWDETDLNRQEIVKSIHNGSVDEDNIRKYLACSSSSSSSSSEAEEEQTQEEKQKNEDTQEELNNKLGYIEKYKALIAGIESNESKNKRNAVDMEVTWNLDLENKANEVVKDKTKEKNAKTPFQQYLEKRKEKKRRKKLENQSDLEMKEQPESGDNIFSDDDIPSDIDLNDPYFKEELNAFKNKKSKKKKAKEELENEESKQEKAELELLMVDVGPENKHFSLKKIEESEKACKKLKKGKRRKGEEINDFKDDFKIDVNDERFSALFTSHHFHIDPADPQFRATKATKELIHEKLKRRKEEDIDSPSNKKANIIQEENANKQNQAAELSHLVKSIKKNTADVRKKFKN